MAIYRIKQIREMGKPERQKKLEELYAELSQQKVMVASGGAIENPSRINLIKRTIAKFLTIMKEEELKRVK